MLEAHSVKIGLVLWRDCHVKQWRSLNYDKR